jgi:CheY-like chemotaxis protein/HPt (histidine-containing phosphotransfer) domain-containing protein
MSEKPSSVSLRILLAEDSQANQEVLTAILRRAGYQVDVAVNGLKAVEAVSRISYDLVLMDLAMPEMDGVEATYHIRNLPGQQGGIPIIALTANAILTEQQRCLQAGMNDYLTKPVSRATLLTVIARWSGCPFPPPTKRYCHKIEEVSAKETDKKLLDLVILERLIEDATLEALPHMVCVFIKEAKSRCQKMVAAVEMGNIEQLEHESHALKSSANIFGAKRLYYATREIELACKQKELQLIPELARIIPGLVRESVCALTEYLATTHNIFINTEIHS